MINIGCSYINADGVKVVEYSNGEIVVMGDAPSSSHVWNGVTRGWEFDSFQAWYDVREKRTRLLAKTDWTQLPDVPEETKALYTTYRQALRDITEQPDPTAIVWPSLPT